MFINQTKSETMNEPNDTYDAQQRQSQQFYSRLFENGRFHKSHIEILAFFKSNYKYKRRNYTTANKPKTAESTQVGETINKIYVAGDEDTSCYCHQKVEEKNITQKLKTKSDNFLLKSINLGLVVVFIVASFLYHKLKLLSLSLIPLLSEYVQLTANSSSSSVTNQNITMNDAISLLDDDDGDDNKDNVANTNEVNRVDFVTEDDDIDGDNFVTTSDNNNDDVNDDSDETCCQQNYDKLSTLGCQQQQQQQKQQHHHNEWLRHQWISLLGRGSASSPSPSASPSPFLLSVVIHTQVMSIFMTLFIALALLSVRCVEGGACWQKTLPSGKCDEIFSLNITKAECCGTNQEFSYTDRELTSVEYFFATAIGGGMECAPCLESCKNVNCGPNKKCAKRKGRPKCICAPECGAAVRRRQRMKLFRGATQPHHYHQPQHHHNSESMFSPVQRNLESAVIFGKSARDIRSLSSEIQSQNLGLTVEDGDEENQSQRKLFIMQSGEVGGVGIGADGGGQLKLTLKGGSGVEIKQRKRLLIVEARGQQHEDKPTTRRLQVISNTNNNNHHGNKRKKSTKLHQQNHHEEEVEAKNNRGSSSATTTVALQSTSRHKFNANSSNNNNSSSNKNMQQTKNFEAKLRHIHQNSRQQLELEADDTPNHHDQQHHGHRRHHQFRKRKKKLHNKLKQDQRQHDNVENVDNATATTTVVVTMSGTRTITATAAAASSTTSTTPVNSSVTEDQRFLNHGSNVATSSSSRLASSSSSSSSALSGSGGLTNIGVGGSSSSHHRTVNSDDMTFDDRIYDKFNLHGFPGQEQQKITQIAKSHSSHHPVCGTDGRTYNTECQLKKRACRTDNTELVVAYRGHCKTTCNGVKCLNGLTCVEDHYTIPHCIACKIDCPLDDDDGAIDDDDEIDASRAVCGVDGKTYKSVCDINRMICKIGRSIAVAYPGPCRDDRVTCSDINCGPKRTCLMDLLTHEPRCVSCRYKCSRKRRPSSLRYEEGKICGVNNRTYNSWCEMRKDSCGTGFFIDVKSFGECQ